MYAFQQLQDEIRAKIVIAIGRNVDELHPTWITQAIMLDHPDVKGADADFHLCCSRVAIRKEVTNQINKTESPDQVDKLPTQLTLEGFIYIQKYYVLGQGKNRVAVRIDKCTLAQLRVKQAELATMGRTMLLHSDELGRYIDLRQEQEDGDAQAATA